VNAPAKRAALTLLASIAFPIAAAAQSPRADRDPRAGSWEIAAAVLWTGGYNAGSAAALETRNPSTGSTPLTLFTTDSRLRGAPGIESRLGVYLGRRVTMEGVFEFSRPVLRSHLGGDFESAAPTDADATITSYVVGGSALYHFGSGRLHPFVEGGAGYLRQLLEDNDGLITGAEFHAGAGLKYRLTHGAHPFALRLDGVASSRSKSAAFDQKRRVVPELAAGLSWRVF
jgi:hypothetical protein